EYTQADVERALEIAQAKEIVENYPEGYEHEVAQGGSNLSGGQKQRLCIARVFLKNPPILILDEATSALDNATEILIQQSLDELCVGRTTLVVAHRLSTIKNANRIAVVSEGEIVEQGSHRELLEKGGAYAELHSKQFRETAEE
ncbi:MAG: ATP-binding cassette domain-containing protein, partial [Clostridia bacterium]|nr:ATP-binding cassette domain-containing protein [Clostridia bacterium]